MGFGIELISAVEDQVLACQDQEKWTWFFPISLLILFFIFYFQNLGLGLNLQTQEKRHERITSYNMCNIYGHLGQAKSTQHGLDASSI